MKSVLFLIPTLDRGGAENVLVNLVNSMDQSKFRITVQTLFDKDSQKDRLRKGIEYRSFLYRQFHGNSRLQAWIPSRILYRLIVRRRYDIIVSYLEGPATHILAGCPYPDTKKVAWVHVEMKKARQLSVGFRSKKEALQTYKIFDRIVFVAETVKQAFERVAGTTFDQARVLYNTVNSDEILKKSREDCPDMPFQEGEFNIISVGRIIPAKGFDRLARVQKRLRDAGYPSHVYILGTGSEETVIQKYLMENGLSDSFTFLGFRDNPYPYVAKADLFVCSSRREGFSTAVTEALILGTPVVSTNCSGAHELLGPDHAYGIVTESREEDLYESIRRLIEDPSLLSRYREKARERGRQFVTDRTTRAVEEMLTGL